MYFFQKLDELIDGDTLLQSLRPFFLSYAFQPSECSALFPTLHVARMIRW